MHNYMQPRLFNSTELITNWVKPIIRNTLPNSCSDKNKIVKELFRVHSKHMELIDSYSNYHMSFKLTSFEEHIAYQISQMARIFMPTFRTNFSPFQPGRRRDERSSTKNPSLTGQSSTGSTASSNSSSSDEDGGGIADESDSSESEDESINNTNNKDIHKNKINQNNRLLLSNQIDKTNESLFPTMKEIYGYEIKNPNDNDMLLYKRYVQIGKLSSPLTTIGQESNYINSIGSNNRISTKNKREIKLTSTLLNENYTDSYECVMVPEVSKESLKIYENYVNSPHTIVGIPSVKDLDVIIKYMEIS